MASLFDTSDKKYYDKREFEDYNEFKEAIKKSSTVYVGNLGFLTREEQLYSLFSTCGDIKRIIMGLDKIKRSPCGFCFVEYAFLFYINWTN